MKTADNPQGVDGQVLEGIKAAILGDRYAYLEEFFNNFYNVDKLGPARISERARQASGASGCATFACVDTWLTDFRSDLPKIDVPTSQHRLDTPRGGQQGPARLCCRVVMAKGGKADVTPGSSS